MNVRAATEEEVGRLAAIWHQGWHEAHAAILPAQLTRIRTLDSFRDRLRAALASVRVVGPPGEPSGFAMVQGDELYQLFVTASARGSGVAAALVAEAEARLAAAGVEIAWLACAIGNERAARFYEKCGWRRTATMINPLDTPDGLLPLEVWRYEKRLRINPGDERYRAVVGKRFNKRFTGRPDYVRLANSTDEVVTAVEEAVREERGLAVTSGGHCLEGFVSEPEVRVVLDVSPMKRVYHDRELGALAVEAGATVGETFRALHEHWGTVLPLGEHPAIGMGGHVVGGAFGFLCRQLGLAADYLYGVEVVTVDAKGRARPVMATREESDPNRELWWAHTGGGGGNFGVVTRYWFRSPGAAGDDPTALLPRAPDSVTTFKLALDWSDLDEASFVRLLRNHGAWCEANSGADSPNATLWTLLELHRRQFGKIFIRGVSTAGAGAVDQIEAHLSDVGNSIRGLSRPELARHSWLAFALDPLPDLFAAPPGGVCVKVKDALLRTRLTDRQIEVAYDYLTRADHDAMGGMLGLATYGGRINTVAPDATASAQRGAILDLACSTGWLEPADEGKNLRWAREFYRELFADTGGVPVPGERYDGAFINHPDTDLADPALNTSGVPWHRLYYRENYPRLQLVKARWDPRNVFRHALSIHAE
jgi:aclacinomycin oxidase